ncbi:unnamed protein product [marine sediment metagenome]|uniref:Uncharacterized protein n=1 Tax=marine sediment metagenome TaxID=412755 RepID=X1QA73_9ZZZZ
MSDKQNLQDAVKTFTKAKKEKADEVSKAIENVNNRQQTQREQQRRQD